MSIWEIVPALPEHIDAVAADMRPEDRREIWASHRHTPAEALQRKELKELIEQAISQLPPEYRVVVALRDLQGLSYADIAAAADLSVDVVRTRLARARNMLRIRLSGYLSD